MNNLEDRLKSLQNQKKSLPSEVSSRIEQTLAGLPEKKQKKKTYIYWTVAAVLLLVLLAGSTYYSPVMAKTFQSLPIIGSVFEKVGDPGLKAAEKKGLTTQLEQTIETDHVSLAFTGVVYDGTRLSIGYIKQWDDEMKQSRMKQMHDIFDDLRFKINGNRLGNYGLGGTGKFLNKNQYAGVMTLTTNQDLPDHFDLTMVVHHLGGEKGEWTATFPVKQINGQKTFLVNEVKTYKNKTVTVNRVTFSPLTTEVRFKVKQSVKDAEENKHRIIDYYLYNDQGMMLQPLGSGGGGSPKNGILISAMKAHYEPVKDTPDYLIFQPVVRNFSNKTSQRVKARWTGKPLELNQGKDGNVYIQDIQSKDDKTVLTYQVEGKDPYMQAGAVWLADETGNQYHSKEPPKRISDSEYLFQRTFPTSDSPKKLSVVTVKLQPTTPIKALRMKIPLTK